MKTIFIGDGDYVTEDGIILRHQCSSDVEGWYVTFGEVFLKHFKSAPEARKYLKEFAYSNFKVVEI